MHHSFWRKMVALSLYRDLTTQESKELQAHKTQCLACRRLSREWRTMLSHLGTPAPHMDAAFWNSQKEQILARLQ
jgi:hypothetical protein